MAAVFVDGVRAIPMKIISTPMPTTSARSIVVPIFLDLDRHDAANDQVADEDHERADDDQDPADDAGEHRLEVGWRHEEHERREQDWQGRDDRARRTSLRGKSLNLAFDSHPLADRIGDVVQDLGQVATDRAVDRIRRGHQVEVLARDALGDVAERLIRRATEVHLADGATEFIADGCDRVLGHGVDGLGEGIAGLERVGEKGQRVTQLAVELLEALADPVFHVEARNQVAEDEREQSEDVGEPPVNDQGHEEAAADLDHEELGRTQLQVGALQLFEDRRLALLGIATAHPVGGQEGRSEEHTSELQSRGHLVCRLLLEKKKKYKNFYRFEMSPSRSTSI